MQLLIATTNPAKLAEYRLLLHDYPFDLVSLSDLGITEHPAETGETFADNARLKARFYFERARRMPTLADDGGLEVDALDGAPGVKSHRWLGESDVSDRALAEAVVRRMEGVEEGRRTARLRAAVALTYLEGVSMRENLAEAAIEGVVARRVHQELRAGFPYRAVLWLPDRGCYIGELGPEEEARISQRRTALEKLAPAFRRVLLRG